MAGSAYAGDFPDPFVLAAGRRYHAYGTQVGSINVQVMVSDDLGHWRHLGDALPALPGWAASGHTWSPSVLARPGGYVLYYAVRHAATGRQCISAAFATRPEGPFSDPSARPFVFQLDRGGSIDPSPFVDANGTAYLLWKSDDNAIGGRTSLWGAELGGDGLAMAGEPVELLVQDRAWEKPLVEAPSLVAVDGVYHLFYSGGWWESANYAVGYAVATRPLEPYRKVTRWRPWLSSRRDAKGPGGAEVFTDLDGSLRIAYHAWLAPRVGYAAGGVRALWVDRLTFAGGCPVRVH